MKPPRPLGEAIICQTAPFEIRPIEELEPLRRPNRLDRRFLQQNS